MSESQDEHLSRSFKWLSPGLWVNESIHALFGGLRDTKLGSKSSAVCADCSLGLAELCGAKHSSGTLRVCSLGRGLQARQGRSSQGSAGGVALWPEDIKKPQVRELQVDRTTESSLR